MLNIVRVKDLEGRFALATFLRQRVNYDSRASGR
jgi:hypothetical protein